MTNEDLLVVRLSVLIEADYIMRDVFAEARGRTPIVSKAIAAPMLTDAQEQRSQAAGPPLKRGYWHLVRQLEQLLNVPAFIHRSRLKALQAEAEKRSEEWDAKLRASEFARTLLRAGYQHEADELRTEVVTRRTFAGWPVPRRDERSTLAVIDALDEIRVERWLAYRLRSSESLTIADSLLDRARAGRR